MSLPPPRPKMEDSSACNLHNNEHCSCAAFDCFGPPLLLVIGSFQLSWRLTTVAAQPNVSSAIHTSVNLSTQE
jgi:hypothetical protein